jgi:type 1 glutamine amidotransferase
MFEFFAVIPIGLFPVVFIQAQTTRAHPSEPAPIRVLLVDGQSGGIYHNWRLTTPVLREELEETGLFQVTVMTEPPGDGNFSDFKPKLSNYQVIVLNYDSPDWPEEQRSQFERFVNNGGGLVVVHAADNAFPNWRAYNLMIGIGGWRGRNEQAGPHWYFKEGKLVSDTAPGLAGNHGNRLPFQIVTRQPEHPIMRGLPPVWMHVADELYDSLRGPGENMTVLATAHSDPKNKGTGHDEPVLMALRYGKGRVFHTTLGHDVAALSCVGFITTFQRGTEWAATGKVTQRVPANFPAPDSVSSRVDIESMDPAFLNGASPIAEHPTPAARPHTADLVSPHHSARGATN